MSCYRLTRQVLKLHQQDRKLLQQFQSIHLNPLQADWGLLVPVKLLSGALVKLLFLLLLLLILLMLLFSVLQKHRADCAVVERACQAIANLSKGQGNTSWFGATGCCEAILAVQKVHFDVQSLNAAAWLAVGNLCKDENNRVKFALGGACDSVIDCLKLHIQSKEVLIL